MAPPLLPSDEMTHYLGRKLLADAHPTIAVLTGRAMRWPQRTDDPINALLAATPLDRDPALPGPSIPGFMACSAIVRKTVFEDVGGFSAILHLHSDERLLAWVLAADGWDGICASATHCWHATGRRRSGRPPAMSAPELRNTLLTNWLRRPLPNVAAPQVCWRVRPPDDAHRGACGEALVALPRVLRERHRSRGGDVLSAGVDPTDVRQWAGVLGHHCDPHALFSSVLR